jgi:hypothetical protein
VNKTDTAHAAQNETFNFNPLFGSDELKLQATPKAVTPFAGMASFFAWLGVLEFPKQVAAVMPFEYRSPNAIAPEQTLMAFISAVVVGASRFAHAGWLRHDKAFHALLGVKRFPGGGCDPAVFPSFHAGAHRGLLASAMALDAGVVGGSEGGVFVGLGFDGVFA